MDSRDWVIGIQDEIIKGLYQKITRLEKNIIEEKEKKTQANKTGMEIYEELLMYKKILEKIVDLAEGTNE